MVASPHGSMAQRVVRAIFVPFNLFKIGRVRQGRTGAGRKSQQVLTDFRTRPLARAPFLMAFPIKKPPLAEPGLDRGVYSGNTIPPKIVVASPHDSMAQRVVRAFSFIF